MEVFWRCIVDTYGVLLLRLLGYFLAALQFLPPRFGEGLVFGIDFANFVIGS